MLTWCTKTSSRAVRNAAFTESIFTRSPENPSAKRRETIERMSKTANGRSKKRDLRFHADFICMSGRVIADHALREPLNPFLAARRN